ncbi:hypothetical protein [Microbacterium trichothecenolyticum]|uniref:Uncharacterized protein n=1 Tax=Microbacterium trichothecenolyticum TaxID=69370 RepID=A0A0M2HLD5_MICTR|nr:hypothetical protein [Microbacterium trichothecenolyticum]KJL45706.1 hypothetical protein RS82_00068 [Microbacterium trichothecenolyticum]
MSAEVSGERRLKFYGPNDYATYWQVEDAVRILRDHDGAEAPSDAAHAIELHNAHQFVLAGFTPASLSEDERADLEATSRRVRSVVARYFTDLEESNLLERVRGVPSEYHSDLLLLLGNNRAFERIGASPMLAALESNDVTLGAMLANKKIVTAYDREVREAILSDVQAAEHVIRRHFARDTKQPIHLPVSFTTADSRDILRRYVEDPGANFNFVALIATANLDPATGVDARLKLAAQRRNAQETKEFFANNTGVKSGCELTISDTQDEPVIESLDGMFVSYSYGRAWLDSTTDEPSILNNFQHLFGFANRNSLLTLPSYRSELAVVERFLTTTGRAHYDIGVAYRVREMSSTAQTRLMRFFLSHNGIDLEAVIAWFFEEYLSTEFGAQGFSFAPTASGSSFLEKVRHLFAEMESVLRQFAFYADDGEIDRELLSLSSGSMRFNQLPSRVRGKYLYATDVPEIVGILHHMLSDQSSLNYISEELRGDNAVELLVRNRVTYDDFAEYQRPLIDQLIDLKVLTNNEGHVTLSSNSQLRILMSLHATEAVSYFHLDPAARAVADEMISRGWLRRESSLLTESEAKYFNYQLNNSEFSNGPALRNKYQHGSQPDGEGDDSHFAVYLVVLKLIIALVIKINDDFCLRDREDGASRSS